MFRMIKELKDNILVLAAAGNKSATRPPLPPPRCGGEWEETGRNWWVGIRAVLTEQQTEGTGTTMIQIRRKIRHELAQQTLSPNQDRRCALPSHE